MSLGTDFKAWVQAVPAVAALVGTRVFALRRPHTEDDYVTYAIVSSTRPFETHDSMGDYQTRLQVTACSTEYLKADAIRKAIYDAVSRGVQIWGGTNIQRVVPVLQPEFIDADTGIVMCPVDYIVWHS